MLLVRLVTLEQALQPARIIACPAHTFLGVFQFVLVQLQLRLGEVEFLLEGLLLHDAAGGKFFLQLLDPGLVGLHLLLRLAD